jgi:hypothetical protein
MANPFLADLSSKADRHGSGPVRKRFAARTGQARQLQRMFG